MNEVEMERRVTAVEDRTKSNTHRLDEMEKRQDNLDELVSSVAVMAKEQEHIKEDITVIKTDVKALTEKPGKRWDGVVDKLVAGLAGAFATALFAGVVWLLTHAA